MTEFVAILTTSWKLISAIRVVVDLIEQTREDGRALQYLERQATSFLDTINQGLVDCEPSPYMSTILSLEGLLQRILETSTALARMSSLNQFLRASQTKRTILDLEKELRFFVDTYLIQTTTQIARINLEAMASPRPVPDPNDPPLIPDDIRWEIMSQSNNGTTTVGPNTRILLWNRGVVNANIDDLEAARSINTEEPIPLAPMTVPEVTPPKSDPNPPNSFKLCWDAWLEAILVVVSIVTIGIPYMIFIGPLHLAICTLDCLGTWCCYCPAGCCSDCCLVYFPICTSKECLNISRCTNVRFCGECECEDSYYCGDCLKDAKCGVEPRAA